MNEYMTIEEVEIANSIKAVAIIVTPNELEEIYSEARVEEGRHEHIEVISDATLSGFIMMYDGVAIEEVPEFFQRNYGRYGSSSIYTDGEQYVAIQVF